MLEVESNTDIVRHRLVRKAIGSKKIWIVFEAGLVKATRTLRAC